MAYRVSGVAILLVAVGLSGCDGFGKDKGVPDGAYSYLDSIPEMEEVASCAEDCSSIRLVPAYTVGEPTDSILLHENSHLVISGSVMSANFGSEPGRPPLYDARTGVFLKTVGRWGHGPGEFTTSWPFPGPRGQLWLFDPGNNRFTVLTEDGAIDRVFPFHGRVYSMSPLDSLRTVISGIVEEEVDSRLSVHVLGPYGNVLRSLGPLFGKDFHGFPKVAVAPDSTIWLGHANAYILEQWSLDGRLLRILHRDVDWFDPWHSAEPDKDGSLNWIQVDPRTGYLWIGLSLPDPDAPPLKHWQGRRITTSVVDSMRDTRFEVIDPSTGRLVATSTFDRGKIHPVHPTGLMHWASPFPDGRSGFVVATRHLVNSR